MDIAKVETSGRSQVVRIPRKFRFKTSQVKISRKGNQIILSPVSQEDKLHTLLQGSLRTLGDSDQIFLSDMQGVVWSAADTSLVGVVPRMRHGESGMPRRRRFGWVPNANRRH